MDIANMNAPRAIKFRAWNKIGKTMFQVNDLDGLLQHTNVSCKHGSNCEEMAGLDQGCANEIELMQYTGLKDVNGVEIYEGDLVKQKLDDLLNTYTVIYEAPKFTLFTLNWPNMFLENNVTVIGNIYENPELLTETK